MKLSPKRLWKYIKEKVKDQKYILNRCAKSKDFITYCVYCVFCLGVVILGATFAVGLFLEDVSTLEYTLSIVIDLYLTLVLCTFLVRKEDELLSLQGRLYKLEDIYNKMYLRTDNEKGDKDEN